MLPIFRRRRLRVYMLHVFSLQIFPTFIHIRDAMRCDVYAVYGTRGEDEIEKTRKKSNMNVIVLFRG